MADVSGHDGQSPEQVSWADLAGALWLFAVASLKLLGWLLALALSLGFLAGCVYAVIVMVS